jgi:hypothetical protein
VGGSGVPAWSKTSLFRDGHGKLGTAKSYGTGEWSKDNAIHKADQDRLNFVTGVVDSIVDGYGISRKTTTSSGKECGESIFYRRVNQTVHTPFCNGGVCESTFCEAAYYVGLIDIYGNVLQPYSEKDIKCCVSQQVRTPNIKGGRLSLNGIVAETTITAMDVWNPSCTDQLGPQTPYAPDQDDLLFPFLNLIGQAFSDVFGGTCGICPAHIPFCDPVLNECRNVTCADAEGYCLEDSTAGVRARQFCPATCGCDNPKNTLVLSSPDFGCPQNCADYAAYDNNVGTDSCEDKPVGSSELVEFVDEVTRISSEWPGFWRDQWATAIAPYVLYYGCYTVPLFKSNPTIPMDLCVDGGFMWPIKPIAYLCPVTCGCSTDMMWGCPTSCSVVNGTT